MLLFRIFEDFFLKLEMFNMKLYTKSVMVPCNVD